MRSAIVAAAFAAGAIAVPYNKRDVVTDTDIVYYTDIVTIYADASSTSTATAASSSSVDTQVHYGHHPWHSQPPPYSAPPSSTPSSVESSAAPSSTYVAPTSSAAPTTTAAPTSTYVAPSSSSVWTSTPAASSSAAASSPAATVVSSVVGSCTAAASATPASALPTDSYAWKATYHHNLHRANHSASDISWDANLACIAESIAEVCYYAHNTTAWGGGYGQNIAAGVQSDNITAIITDLFYNGEVGWFDGLYGQAQPSMTDFEHWGHFSQIVWKGTGRFGCATVDCTSKGLGGVASDVSPYFTVCNYEDPGNYANEYGTNIGNSLNKATVEWNAGL